jgi:hypothetical protein
VFLLPRVGTRPWEGRIGNGYIQPCNLVDLQPKDHGYRTRDLAERLERCASIPKIACSGGSGLTLRSDLLLTARGSST